ncbi:MAG: hypothetical protein A2Z32_12505 [Chloroflexi bacterium RBG_16_69_14]|nr:MAG: hypothetical protein A2Z32_12505 [Chloroflexi bacterium RBG_16_69_14]
MLLSLSAASATLIVPSGMFAATTTCDEGRWPARVQGQPATFAAGARAGDYLWHDANGWHLRVTHPGTAKVIFNGTVTSNAALTVRGYRLETGDGITLSADKKTLTYRFANHGRVDGLDFRTACASRLWFKGSMAGAKLPVGRIWIGRAGHHPLQNPFVILRNS